MTLPAVRSTFHISRWQLFHLYFCFVVFVLAVTNVLPAFDFGFFMKRARVLQELLGDANYHQDRIARQVPIASKTSTWNILVSVH